MQKTVNLPKYQIALVDGIDIDGENKNVPFILIEQNSEIECEFLNNKEKKIQLTITGNLLLIDFEFSNFSYQILLHDEYLKLISNDGKINFGVLSNNNIVYCFSFNNIKID